jgi:hypothetical protein
VPTRKQTANLKRGGVQGSSKTAARARAAKADYRASDEALATAATTDPWGAYQELHATMTRHISKLLRDEERSGGKPSREVTDRLREYRVTTQALSEYRGNLEPDAQARAFFETLDERIGNIQRMTRCPNCAATVEIFRPVGEL